jgi:hypothetical protein
MVKIAEMPPPPPPAATPWPPQTVSARVGEVTSEVPPTPVAYGCEAGSSTSGALMPKRLQSLAPSSPEAA